LKLSQYAAMGVQRVTNSPVLQVGGKVNACPYQVFLRSINRERMQLAAYLQIILIRRSRKSMTRLFRNPAHLDAWMLESVINKQYF